MKTTKNPAITPQFVITSKFVAPKVNITKRTQFLDLILSLSKGGGRFYVGGNPKKKMLNTTKQTQFPAFSGEF